MYAINKPVRSDSVYSVLRSKGGANECCICNKIIEPSKKFTKITEGLDETFLSYLSEKCDVKVGNIICKKCDMVFWNRASCLCEI